MKAAVCYEYGKPLVVEEIDIDPPQKSEVKVRIAATAVCHSDIHLIRGEFRGVNLPIVPGHESSGYVEEVGEGVTSVKPGDAVCIMLMSPCGKCHYCIIIYGSWQTPFTKAFCDTKGSFSALFNISRECSLGIIWRCRCDFRG